MYETGRRLPNAGAYQEVRMIHKDLEINGQKITKEDEIPAFFAEKRFTCCIHDYVLEVEFSADRHAFIGWLNGDEEVCYFDNGSGQTDSVELLINICPEARMMCRDPDVLKEIVLYFCETGQRSPRFQWIRDTV